MAVLWMRTPAYGRMNPIRAQLRGYAARRFSRLSRVATRFFRMAMRRSSRLALVHPHELMLRGGRISAGSGRNRPLPVAFERGSIVDDGELHSAELADELAVDRVKASAELLRGDGGEPICQGGLELGDAPRDCFGPV